MALVAPHILADAYAKLSVESVGESIGVSVDKEQPEPTAAETPQRYAEFVNEGEEPVEARRRRRHRSNHIRHAHPVVCAGALDSPAHGRGDARVEPRR